MKIKQKWLTEIVYNELYENFRVSATLEVRMHNIIRKEVVQLNKRTPNLIKRSFQINT